MSEAQRAVRAGVDVVVAQGWEAGGIGDGRGLAAVLALGAQAGMVGTRFLATHEAATHDVYRRRVIAADASEAIHTRCFDKGWPDAPHRALHNKTIAAWESAGRPGSPDRPGENDLIATDRDGAYRRYEDRVPLAGMIGQLDEMALYAGQSAGVVRDVARAAEAVERMVEEARDAIANQTTLFARR